MTLSETHIHDPDPPNKQAHQRGTEWATKMARAAGWTEKQEEDLRSLIEGREHSFAEIGGLIGKSPAAVARRVKSLGIELPKNFQTVRAMRARGFSDWKPGQIYQRPGRTPKPTPALEVVEFIPEDFTEFNVHGIDALEPHHCRWICNSDVSEPVYCGLPRIENSRFSYCAGHHRICTKPVPERRTA